MIDYAPEFAFVSVSVLLIVAIIGTIQWWRRVRESLPEAAPVIERKYRFVMDAAAYQSLVAVHSIIEAVTWKSAGLSSGMLEVYKIDEELASRPILQPRKTNEVWPPLDIFNSEAQRLPKQESLSLSVPKYALN